MNKNELEAELRRLEAKHQETRSDAIRDYCLKNNTVKVGDVFTDHLGSVLVDKIGFHYGFGKACCTYYGVELTKKLEPKKNGSRRVAYQSNKKEQS